MVMDQLPAYGDEWSGVNLADSQDGLYNPEKAKAEFAKAKEALQAEGVQFPIHLDVPVNQSNKIFVNQVQSLKQSIESALGKIMLYLIFTNCQLMISITLPTLLQMQRQRIGICQ